ncbi:MAG: hypothetical protein PSX37_05365, partial [bacterium]|nr:hypothetical protein [bacterium]
MVEQPQYRVGDVVNGHVWTGTDWQPAPPPPGSPTYPVSTTGRAGLIPTADPNVKIGTGRYAGFYLVGGKWKTWDEQAQAYFPAKVTWWSRRHFLDRVLIILVLGEVLIFGSYI